MEEDNEENSDLIIFTEIKEKLNDQLNSITSLDTKSGITIALEGTFIIGIFNSNFILNMNKIILIILLFVISLSALLAFISIFVRRFHRDPDPKNLIDGYKDKSAEYTISQLIVNFKDNYYKNEKSINSKKNLMNFSFILIFISIIVIFLGMLLKFTNLC